MSFGKDFKAFVMRGNVVDLAVGVIIGAAFGKIVSSLVGDVIMPPIGLALGGVNFDDWVITLRAANGATPAVVMKLGTYIKTMIDFLFIAFAVFMLIRAVSRFMPKPEAPVTTKNCSECAMPIPLAAKRCGHCCEVQR